MTRAAGVLLHPTCLPGPFGVGDLGPSATGFADWLSDAGQTYWQILPLSPVAGSGSPYRSYSAFAGNPLLISPEVLVAQGLLSSEAVEELPHQPGNVHFGAATLLKTNLLRKAARCRSTAWAPELRARYEAFRDDPQVRDWLDEWAVFAALKGKFKDLPWFDWPDSIRRRDADTLAAAREELAAEIQFNFFVQFLFFDQWEHLRAAARRRGISFVGDLAIYVAPDSADVWSNQRIFDLDDEGHPRTVAGVPPDYFSKTGQLWGNPLYRWDRLAEDDFDWWVRRLAWSLRSADLIRLDHFRGFAAFWEVKADETTAVVGRWRSGPGLPFFEKMRNRLGELPLIAEDLGVVTEDVRALRKGAGLPGTRVLQFGLSNLANEHTPHHLSQDTVVYTGTHDNDTARGWLESLEPESRNRALTYVGGPPEEFSWNLIRVAFTSIAETAIVPLQDLLDLDSTARLNVPGEGSDQWTWRLPALPNETIAGRLRALTEASERLPKGNPNAGKPA
jgi:4-alpha-glucanotransferase